MTGIRDDAPMMATTYHSFSKLPSGYTRLFDDWGAVGYNYTPAWFENFVETALDPDQQLRIYGIATADRPSTPVAALPMRHRTRSGWMPTPRRLWGVSNYYTSLFGPVVDRGRADRIHLIDELVRAICADRPRWDIVDLNPLDRESPMFAEFRHALTRHGMLVQPYFAFGNWYLEVAGRSYADYLGGLPSVLRKNIPYYTRKLQKTFDTRIDLVTTNDGFTEALAAYDKVYRASWKHQEPYPNFVPGLSQTALKNGWLRLGVAYLDGEPAAAQLWFVHAGIAAIFKVSYDERFAKHSVGTVLTAKIMEHVIDIDKVHTVDFLSGDDGYKKHWMSHRRERWGLYAMNTRTITGCVSILRHVGGRAMKSAWAAWKRLGTEGAARVSGKEMQP